MGIFGQKKWWTKMAKMGPRNGDRDERAACATAQVSQMRWQATGEDIGREISTEKAWNSRFFQAKAMALP